ncbi:MAG: lipid IV(A) 3-deoxy-D-manno-octulosonic acid transferase [Candidatus Polarisedimenticolaceae bacterium]|nr:lipid IV(A) 3-deoxy-D-manno-octulosonic acid transferase [Candidatus Polarisedimenticolaceae bacterium]
MRYLYTTLLALLVPFMLLRLLWRSRREPAYRQRWHERFGWASNLPIKPIWIHAVSVGEVQATEVLVRHLLKTYPDKPLLLTTTTPTGSARVEKLFADQVSHCYLPFDLPWLVGPFINQLQPSILIIIETEIWPNLLVSCAQQNIPTLLANARLSVRSANGYRRFSGLTAETLNNLTMIAAQGAGTARRFTDLGASPARIEETGSIKFDIQLPATLHEQAEALRRSWGTDRHVWVAASTHEGEEQQILTAHKQIKEKIPDALLILVPRHPGRFDSVAKLVTDAGFKLIRRTQATHCNDETDVFLGDTMGELPMFLASADLAFIGGSLIPRGGHNILEPAALGLPILFGPHMFNFAEISQLFLDHEAAYEVNSAEQLAHIVTEWLQKAELRSQIGENGLALIKQNRGALLKLLTIIDRLLSQ